MHSTASQEPRQSECVPFRLPATRQPLLTLTHPQRSVSTHTRQTNQAGQNEGRKCEFEAAAARSRFNRLCGQTKLVTPTKGTISLHGPTTTTTTHKQKNLTDLVLPRRATPANCTTLPVSFVCTAG